MFRWVSYDQRYKQEVEYQKNKKVNIKLVEKISLKEDLSDIFKKEVSKKIDKGKENILIVSSSKLHSGS